MSSAFHISISSRNVIADKMQTEMLKCSRDQENKTVNILKIVFKNEKIVMSPSCIVKRLKVLEHGKPPTTCFEAFKWTLKMDLRAHKRLFVLLLVSFYHSADSFKTGYTNRGDSTAKIFFPHRCVSHYLKQISPHF